MQRHSSPREVGAQRKNEEKCVSYSNPSSLLFIVLGQLQEVGVGTAGWDQGFIRKHHVAAAH
jgi:hypothetical protein